MNTTVNFKIAVIVSLAVILFTASGKNTPQKLSTCSVIMYNSSGKAVRLNAEIADSDKERETGLMFRKSMPADHGMLFVFDEDRILSFWMKNTHIPLDIAFIDSDGVIRDIYSMMPLDTSVIYTSSTRVRYALEVNSGWFSAKGISVGSKTGLNGCVGK